MLEQTKTKQQCILNITQQTTEYGKQQNEKGNT